jgi:hypothetical protein
MHFFAFLIPPTSWTRAIPSLPTLPSGRPSFLAFVLALLLLFFCGCGSAGVSRNAAVSPSVSFDISGNITPASAANGATLTLSGPAALTTTASSSGNFSFAGLSNGTYVVTPSRSGYSFSPSSQTVTISGANGGASFSASPQVQHSVQLDWDASATTVAGNNIYRGSTSGGPYSKINPALITLLHYTDSTVGSGNTYYYVSTSVDSSGKESAYSDQVTAVIP